MERRHFLKLTFGFIAGAAALASGANEAAPLPPVAPEGQGLVPKRGEAEPAVTTQDDVDRLAPEQVRWRRRWGYSPALSGATAAAGSGVGAPGDTAVAGSGAAGSGAAVIFGKVLATGAMLITWPGQARPWVGDRVDGNFTPPSVSGGSARHARRSREDRRGRAALPRPAQARSQPWERPRGEQPPRRRHWAGIRHRDRDGSRDRIRRRPRRH